MKLVKWFPMIRIVKFVTPVLLLLTINTFAQTGKVVGTLVDSETGEGMIGANIVLDGTTIGAATDLDGKFSIDNVPAGVYDLVVSSIGYAKSTITGVQVTQGQTTKIEYAMSPESVTTDEVIVTAQAVENSEAGLLIKRQKAITVSDAISAEQISRTGSGDAAEAVKQVVGASVVDGKYVFVRGLGGRYSSTQLNGTELPSSDPEKKAFQLDLLPTNLLENIVTIKSFTPDKPGNFSGGIVDVATKKFPEQLTFKYSLSATYNSQSTFNDDYVTYQGGDTDWLGIDDGTRELPGVLTNGTYTKTDLPSNTAEVRRDPEGAKAQASSEVGKEFGSIMGVTNEAPPINQSMSMSLGNEIALGEETSFGFLGSFTYGRDFSFYDDGKIGIFKGVDGAEELDTLITFSDRKGTSTANLGGLFAFSFNLSSNHQVGGNVFYSRSGTSTGRVQEGYWLQELDTDRIVTNRILTYVEREILSYQLRGEHYFKNVLDATFDWTASFSETSQDEPDRRLTFSYYDETRDKYTINGSNFDNPSRYFRKLDDSGNNFTVNLEIPFEMLTDKKSKFKTGVAYSYKDRDFNERIFTYIPDGTTFDEVDGDVSLLFAPENFDYYIETNPVTGLPTLRGNVITENSKIANNYSGEEKVTGYYGMFELPITDDFRFIGGLRYEHTDIDLSSADTTKVKGDIDEGDLLPSVNFIYSISERMNVRLSGTQTLARPNFREIAPYSSKEFVNGFTLVGNPELDRTLIQNYDLRWEYFMRPGEIVAVSLFYKKMKDPIERSFIGQENNRIVSYENVGEAEIMGAEFEVRTRLDYISEILENFSFGGNLSLVSSEVSISDEELEIRRAIDPGAEETRELQGQSPFILNLDLTYMHYDAGTTASLHFNIFGERLSSISRNFTPDVYEQPAAQLDFVVSQEIMDVFTIKAAVKNLLDTSYKEVHKYRGDEYVFYEYNRGMSFNVGLSYSL